jgi:hypothetical protein
MYDVHDFMRKKPTCIHLSMSGTQVSSIHADDAPHNPPAQGARAHKQPIIPNSATTRHVGPPST